MVGHVYRGWKLCRFKIISWIRKNNSKFKDVKLVNEEYTINSEQLDFYSETGHAYLFGPTTIVGETTNIYCERGFYDTENDVGHFIKNSRNEFTVVSNYKMSADIFYEIIESSIENTIFKIIVNNPPADYNLTSRKEYLFKTSIFPNFNISNLVFAICSIGFYDFSEKELNDLSFLKLPKGRSEYIQDIPAHVIIDYAHNPEGFRFFLSSIKEYFENLIIVFGCGGDRDKSKRPKMLKAATDNGNRVIFTTDNSRNESFSDIYSDAINQNNDQKVTVIEDRKEAIIYGSSILRKNDCLVILGKGHEETQDINGKKLHFSDHEVVNEIYK